MDHADGVTAVPMAAIYSAGGDSYVFTRTGTVVQPVKVKVGRTNETHAELLEGPAVGADVVILQVGQGQQLLERAGIKVAAATQPSDDHQKHPKVVLQAEASTRPSGG